MEIQISILGLNNDGNNFEAIFTDIDEAIEFLEQKQKEEDE